MAKVLLVEDDESLAGNIVDWLSHQHHLVEVVNDGKTGMQQLNCCDYDVVILDWALPNVSGLDICQSYKSAGGRVPVLMLTGRNSETDKTTGLDSGADDYLTKPFHMEELSARIRALLRRATGNLTNTITVGPLLLDLTSGSVEKNGAVITLLPKERALIEFLMRHPNEVFSAETLLQRVWSSDSDAGVEAVKSSFKRLRKKLQSEGEPAILHTVHGIGFKIDATGN